MWWEEGMMARIKEGQEEERDYVPRTAACGRLRMGVP
jgi:hypothetical protein